MCLGVPGRVIAIDAGDGSPWARRGRVDFGGAQREISLALLPEAGAGDYVIVHAGVAIARVDEAAAAATLALLGRMNT